MKLIKVFENDNFIIDYDKDNKKYRVSYFEDHHFKEECWFDEYGVLDCSDIPDEVIDKFNSIGCTSFRMTPDELREILERQENA